MRLFVGIEIGAAIATAASEVIEQLRRRTGQRAPRARVSWVVSENLHVTVRFIGQADEARAATIRRELEPALEAPAFELTVEGVGAFPPKGAPRVFWAGLTDGRDGLLTVEQEVSTRLEPLVPREPRPYAPHLTLARVKDPTGLAQAALVEGLGSPLLGRVHVGAITLFESRLSSKGPTYLALQRTALRLA